MPDSPLPLLAERRQGMTFRPKTLSSHNDGNGWKVTDGNDWTVLGTSTGLSGNAETDVEYDLDPNRVVALVFTRPDASTGDCVEDVASWELATTNLIGTPPVGYWGDGDETVSGIDMHYIAGWHGSLDTHYYHTARTILTIDGKNAACLVYAVDTDQTYSRESVEALLVAFVAQVARV